MKGLVADVDWHAGLLKADVLPKRFSWYTTAVFRHVSTSVEASKTDSTH